jgi:hypothetical protein
MPRAIAIVAASAAKAKKCAEVNGLTDSYTVWRYIWDPVQLLGLRGSAVHVWFYGDWWNHPRAEDIEVECRLRNLTTMDAPVNERVTKLQQNPGDPRLVTYCCDRGGHSL